MTYSLRMLGVLSGENLDIQRLISFFLLRWCRRCPLINNLQKRRRGRIYPSQETNQHEMAESSIVKIWLAVTSYISQ